MSTWFFWVHVLAGSFRGWQCVGYVHTPYQAAVKIAATYAHLHPAYPHIWVVNHGWIPGCGGPAPSGAPVA